MGGRVCLFQQPKIRNRFVLEKDLKKQTETIIT